MSTESLYDELSHAVGRSGDRALIRLRTVYQPAGGQGAKIYPPTYPTEGGAPYVTESRIVDGVERENVLLDSTPSQSNRAEIAVLRAFRAARVRIPILEIRHEGSESLVLSSLELPHRYADAYLRDSEIDGMKFDKTELGKSFQRATPEDAGALYRHDPGSLVFGAWNSHRKGRQAKFPRVYASEIVGWDPKTGSRKAGRMDPLNLTGIRKGAGDSWEWAAGTAKAKDQKLSEIGHGNIAPGLAHGGVTISSGERIATLSMAALDRVGFGSAPHEWAVAARSVLAAYALMADRLAFGSSSLWLRSGCELVVTQDVLEWVGRGGVTEPFSLGVEEALALFDHSCTVAADRGLGLSLDPVTLVPGTSLAAAIDFSLTRAETTEA